MLPTLVIGLREGLEAALIVGIVAAFLTQRGRRDLLRQVWAGVAVAAAICLAVGIGLKVLSADLPQRQQEGLETVIGAVAVATVTYMVVWMRRHSRDLKRQLEGAAGTALESGSGRALVLMAFLAVFREGFETAVFLVAAFNGTTSPAQAGLGALLGVVVATALGYGIYRGGIGLNLSRFFRATGFVLVLVAAGLVVTALHTAHEAGWLNVGQGRTVDLSWLVRPGSVQSSLLTGVLGLQPRPVTVELVGWLLYLVPLGLYVLLPAGRSAASRTVARVAAAVGAVAVVGAVSAVVVAPDPGRPNHRPAGSGDAAPPDLRTVDVTLSAAGCPAAHVAYAAGPLTFRVENTDATGVTEIELLDDDRILGEKENMAPGFTGSFSLVLQPGHYTIFCPGAASERHPLTITGTPVATAETTTRALLAAGAKDYQHYVIAQTDALLSRTRPLVDAIRSGNLAAAQAAYVRARPYYERIEPVAESFTTGPVDLDAAIDARADDVPATRWTGFHRIEKGLFADRSVAGLAPFGDALLIDLQKLGTRIDGLGAFQPAQLANGAVGLLDEAAKNKITGEEERYSKIDLLDFAANVAGAAQAFAYLEDGLRRIDPALVTTIKTAFARVDALLRTLRDASQLSGYQRYDTVSRVVVTRVAQALQAVAEPLSRVAGKVVTA